MSVILITQSLFHQGHYFSDISLNAHDLVALKHIRNKQFMYLAHQVYSEDNIRIYNAYLDATQQPHVNLILDLTLE